MGRELDVRNFKKSRITTKRSATLVSAAQKVSDALPGEHRVEIKNFDAATGNASHIVSTQAPKEKGNFIQRALTHVQSIAPAMGLVEQAQAAEYVADPSTQKTSSGAVSVNLQQRYKGIPVFQAASMVRFAPDESLIDTVGNTVSVAADTLLLPNVSLKDAVITAAKYVSSPDDEDKNQKDQFGQPLIPPHVDLSNFEPKVRAAFTNTPEQSAVLDPGPFGDVIKASLVWFPEDDKVTLGWNVFLTMPESQGQYNTIVDAEKGKMLYCHQVMSFVAAVGNVFQVNGTTGSRIMTPFPRPINDYGLQIPSVAQNNWSWCHKCQSLYFSGGSTQGVCAAGGSHSHTGSGNYSLVHDSAHHPGQSNWRWCNKCQALHFGGSAGVCPAGGTHSITGSGNYTIQNQAPLSPGQHMWRWCHKCQNLYFAGSATQGVCAAGGAHDQTGSGDYSLINNPPSIPAVFPDTWVATNQTTGNATKAHLSTNAVLTGTTVGGTLTFNPASETGDDQKILNIFYYCSYMHDFSYLLGFREADGNFQLSDFGRGGVQNDPVNAISWPGAVNGTANMSSPPDGSSPTMNMGLFTPTNRHTAFDSTVVFHEFTHGISGRLIGGPLDSNSLGAPQSNGMNEGWSDYMACTINNVVVLGDWLLNNTAGIRHHKYDSSFPDNFGSLGTGLYAAGASGQPVDEHNVGEIWCAVLMEVNRKTDRNLAVQLVIDAQKLTAANPSFLSARDAILLALEHMVAAGRLNTNQHDGAWQGMWMAFCKFGMGPAATSNGTQLTGNVAKFTIGQNNWRWCHKCQGMYFGGSATQGVCPAGGQHDHTGSGNYDLVHDWAAAPGQNNWKWCNKCQGLHFAGSAGVCPAGGAHNVAGSGDYKLIFNAWGSPAQTNWKWCNKCQGLHFGASPGVCPAGGTHNTVNSGDYSIAFT
ncbi:M36 family metallopeptidase [Mucilaginibacter sp. OK098]|uniref:M36 family metallopeptidase n=1 Tax=Mucilaginibacter sp. OK098 TaxID=1855297 RepID=UPI00135635E0|nr:M36 family metallopeptidase [Mucilaginibacter sp. OK098]